MNIPLPQELQTGLKEALEIQTPTETQVLIARLTEIRADLTNIAEHLNRTGQFGAINIMNADECLNRAVESLRRNEGRR